MGTYKEKLGKDYDESFVGYPNYFIFQKAIQKELKKFASHYRSKKIKALEAGCGTGETSKLILELSRNMELIAVDNDPDVLAEAKKKLAKYKNVKFVKQDIENFLNNNKQNFDVFIQASVFHNLSISKRKRIIKKAFMALKPGGAFINADKIAQDNIESHRKSLIWQLKKFDLFDNVNRPDLKERWAKHYLDDEKIKLSEKEAVDSMTKAGFKKISKPYRRKMEAILIGFKLD